MKQMLQRSQTGSALLEAAIVLPILFLMVFAIIQYGFLYGALITLRNASAVAARVAILGTAQTSTQVCSAAGNAISGMLNPAQLVCQTNPAVLPAAALAPVTVTLSYPIPIIATYPGLHAGPTWTLSVQTTMQ